MQTDWPLQKGWVQTERPSERVWVQIDRPSAGKRLKEQREALGYCFSQCTFVYK